MTATPTQPSPAPVADGAVPVDHSAVELGLVDLAAGRPVVVLRQGSTGNASGALVLAASTATPEQVAFVVRYTTGFLCVSIDEVEATRLGLPPMALDNQREDGICYAVTVDASEGITTGISAADRARTINLLGDPGTVAAHLSRPGHVVPVIAAAAGVLDRPGFAEAGRDLAALAGLHPAALVADVVTEDGSLAGFGDLLRFAAEHQLICLDMTELISYRARREWSLERMSVRRLPAPHERVEVTEYRQPRSRGVHLAFTCGALRGREDVPLYVHPACPDGDLFGGSGCDCRSRLDLALSEIEQRGLGVLLYLPPADGPTGAGRHGRLDAARTTSVANLLRDLGPRSVLLPPWQSEELLALREHGVRLHCPHAPRPEQAIPLPGAAA